MEKNKFVSPILMWLIVILGIVIIFNIISSQYLFSRNYFTITLFLIASIYWVFFFLWSLKFHKKAPLSVAKISKLIKEGPYRFVRHPLYSADIVLGVGIFLLFPTKRDLFSLVWLILVLSIWMKLEESSLIKKFGREYNTYRAKTPMFVPDFTIKGGKNEKT